MDDERLRCSAYGLDSQRSAHLGQDDAEPGRIRPVQVSVEAETRARAESRDGPHRTDPARSVDRIPWLQVDRVRRHRVRNGARRGYRLWRAAVEVPHQLFGEPAASARGASALLGWAHRG